MLILETNSLLDLFWMFLFYSENNKICFVFLSHEKHICLNYIKKNMHKV